MPRCFAPRRFSVTVSAMSRLRTIIIVIAALALGGFFGLMALRPKGGNNGDGPTKGVEPVKGRSTEPREPAPASPETQAKYEGEVILLPQQTIAPGEAGIVITVKFPGSYKLNAEAPSFVEVVLSGDLSLPGGEKKRTVDQPEFPLRLPMRAATGDGQVQATLNLYYCEAKRESLCYFKEVQLIAPVSIAAGGAGEVVITFDLPLPRTVQ